MPAVAPSAPVASWIVPPEAAVPVPVTVKLPEVLFRKMPFGAPVDDTLVNDNELVVAPVKLTAVPVVLVTLTSATVRLVALLPVMPVLVPERMSRPRTSEPVAIVTVPLIVGRTPPVGGSGSLKGDGVIPLMAEIEADAPCPISNWFGRRVRLLVYGPTPVYRKMVSP